MINGGYILIARKLFDSEIFNKPPLYMKLWMWMIGKAYFKDNGNLKRGQFFTTIEEMRNAMSYKVGYRQVRPTVKEIRCAYESLTKGGMTGTTKGTRGLVITICNYDLYQDIKNYEGQHEGQHEGRVEGTLIKKERIKNVKKENKENTYTLADARNLFLSLGVNEQHLSDWFVIRKAKKLPPTKTGFEAIIKEAEKASMSVPEVIKKCCEKNWGGFEASWLLREVNSGKNRGGGKGVGFAEAGKSGKTDWLS